MCIYHLPEMIAAFAKEGESAMSRTKTSTYEGFTAEERAAMKDHAEETKKQAQGAEAERDVLAKIAAMTGADRAAAERVHELVKANAPMLAPKLWYGMPAYARNGKIVCHFQPSTKFKSRYPTLGFSDQANLDDGAMWATSFALTELTAQADKRIATLIRQAVS